MATDIRQLLPTNVRAALLAGSAPSSINPYVTASALSSFGFVPYTGATANVDLGAFSLTTPQITGVSGNLTLTNAIQSSGAITQFTFTNVANTNQTLGTNIPNFRVTGANKQWATGTVANQYWNYLTANTAAFVGASTITNSYGLFVEAATAGTNATITNNYAAGFNGGGIIVRGATGTALDVGNTFGLLTVVASSGVTSAYNLFVTNGSLTIQTTTPVLVFNNTACAVRRNTNSLRLDSYDDMIFYNTLTTVETGRVTSTASWVLGNAAIATNATDGFLYITSCPGIPTGVPTAKTGRVPIVIDSTNNKMYIYSGGSWVALN